MEAVHLSTPLFSPFSVPWGLGSALHYTERQAPIAWATERLGFRPRLRSGQRGWLYDQGTIPGIHSSPHFPTPNNFGFVMKQQFFLLDPQVTAPPPICLSFHPVSGRPRNRRRLRTPGHETTAGTRKQEVTCLLDGIPGSPPGRTGAWGRVPPPRSLFLQSPRGLMQSDGADSSPRAQSSPACGIPGPRNRSEEAGRGWSQRTSRARPALNSGDRRTHRRATPDASLKGTQRERRPGTLTTSAAAPRLFLSRPGSLSVFSFSPTSGAQRCLIVRDWEPALPPPERCVAHAGNARLTRSPAPPASAVAVAVAPARFTGVGCTLGFGASAISSCSLGGVLTSFSWISKAPGKRAEEASGSPRGDAELAVWARQYARVGSEARLYPWKLGVACGQVQPGSEAL